MSNILTRLQEASDLLLQSGGSHAVTTTLIDPGDSAVKLIITLPSEFVVPV